MKRIRGQRERQEATVEGREASSKEEPGGGHSTLLRTANPYCQWWGLPDQLDLCVKSSIVLVHILAPSLLVVCTSFNVSVSWFLHLYNGNNYSSYLLSNKDKLS